MGYIRIKNFFTRDKHYHVNAKEIVSEESYQKAIEKFQRNRIPQKLAAILEIKPNKRCVCLDIGCWFGWFGVTLAKEYPLCQFIGIDTQRKHLEIAKVKNPYPNNKYMYADASKVPFPDRFADYILLYNAFEHLEKPLKVLKEIRRVLKKDGRVFLTVPNKYGRGHLDSLNLGRVIEYSYFELIKIFRQYGFKSIFLPLEIKKEYNFFKKNLVKIINASGIWKIFKPSAFRIILRK